MCVKQFYMNNGLRNFNYIVYDLKTLEAIFFDPYSIEQGISYCKANNLVPKYLINTHSHADHIRENSRLMDSYDVKLLTLSDKEVFQLGSIALECVVTEGHVSGHKCYIVSKDNNQVGFIAGDAVFNAGVGNCKNGGNVEELYESTTSIIYKLPDELKVYTSHDYLETNIEFAKTLEPSNRELDLYKSKYLKHREENKFFISTIKEEKLVNPFLRLNSDEIKSKFNDKLDQKQLFIEIRKLRDTW